MRTILPIFVLAVCVTVPAAGQAIRFDSTSTTTSAQCVSGKQCPLLVLPGTQVNFCQGTPGTLAACLGSPATTYRDASAGVACSTTAQLTPATGGACLSTADAQGGYGAWLLPGSYGYYLRVPATAGGGTYGPYALSIHGDSGGYTLDSLYTTLASACTAAGSGTLAITKAWNATPSQTLGCSVWFLGDGKIQTNTGASVVFGGAAFSCPATQRCLDSSTNSGGAFTWTIAPPSFYPKWWGAKGDGSTDDTPSVKATVAAACHSATSEQSVILTPGVYIVAPVVAADPIIPMCSNLAIRGPGGFKIKDNAGSFHTILGPSSGCVSNVTSDGVYYNMNSTNNPVTTLTGFFDSVPRMAITTQSEVHAAACGSNLTVQNNHFSDVRSAWLIFTAAANSRILNNLIDGVGGGSLDADSSLIYGDPGSAGTIVSDNQIIASAAAAPMARTAIEFHDSALIHDNLSDKMEIGIIPDGAAPHVVTMKVHDNKITDTYYCMQVWSETSIYTTGRTGTVGLADTDISHNHCSITLSKYPLLFGEGSGIVTSRFSTADFSRLNVTDNDISYELSASAADLVTPLAAGVGFYDDGTSPTPLRCDDCNFSRNKVTNAVGLATVFLGNGSNLNIDGAIITNPGSSLNPSLPSYARSGILIQTRTLPIDGYISIKGGSYTDNLSPSRWINPISLATDNTAGSIIVDGPTIQCVDATCASMVAGGITVSTNTQLPYVRATIGAPFAKLFPVQPFATQSSIYDLRNSTLYSWQGPGGIWSSGLILHPGTPTVSDCGPGAAITVGSNDRGGSVTAGSGEVTSCTVTFSLAFNSDPIGSLMINSNTTPMAPPEVRTITPIQATLIFTGVHLQLNLFTWSFPQAN